MMDQPRRHARLSFTGRTAPRLETDARTYEVVDLSPDGIRFRSSRGVEVTIGEALHGTLLFPANRAVDVAGRVLRVSGAEAAVLLEEGTEHLAQPVPMGAALPRRTGLLW